MAMRTWDGKSISDRDIEIVEHVLNGGEQKELAERYEITPAYLNQRIRLWHERGVLNPRVPWELTEAGKELLKAAKRKAGRR